MQWLNRGCLSARGPRVSASPLTARHWRSFPSQWSQEVFGKKHRVYSRAVNLMLRSQIPLNPSSPCTGMCSTIHETRRHGRRRCSRGWPRGDRCVHFYCATDCRRDEWRIILVRSNLRRNSTHRTSLSLLDCLVSISWLINLEFCHWRGAIDDLMLSSWPWFSQVSWL